MCGASRRERERAAQLNMVLGLLLLVVFVRGITSTGSVPTYQQKDRRSGETLTCNQCPKGTYVVKHCTRDQQTVCGPCPSLHYTAFWNYLDKCRYCNVFCGENQVETRQCSATHNRVCECQPGYYLNFEFCMKHSTCPPGYGVSKPGDANADTKCDPCLPGHFAASSSKPCRRHTDCASSGLEVNVPGTRSHDTLCTTCRKYKHQGTGGNSSDCDQAVVEFLAYQNIPLKKLKHLDPNFRHNRKQSSGTQKEWAARKQLLALLTQWQKTTGDKPLIDTLLERLKRAKLHHVEEKLKRRFLTQLN
ncbi:tumor necrosis factor receptor superfamily member 6B [Latimeria chalumnae]|uniref:TNF receptor superfamily member 6b n=1 Tax=Latimeria chalumnae TaxID=7897 RepID=H3A0J8_LATCH|nr:PREDICTED: tumor necrosis factor receptor superfamily member 6B [Latimeria chalumnae]|eukprot:XP_006008800.1 PREDICTED: tumor necrosis factor receptor superfamily member 6B [Latimeria chalumnae]